MSEAWVVGLERPNEREIAAESLLLSNLKFPFEHLLFPPRFHVPVFPCLLKMLLEFCKNLVGFGVGHVHTGTVRGRRNSLDYPIDFLLASDKIEMRQPKKIADNLYKQSGLKFRIPVIEIV